MNSFSDWRRPHMARGDFMYGEHVIVISANLPKAHVADEIVAVPWPSAVRWVLRLLRRPVWPRRYVQGAKVEHDQIVMAAGKTFVSPATWEYLKRRRKVTP